MNVIPGFEHDSNGKPIIADHPASLYAYGHLIRSSEQLILDLFSKGLLSGTTHTCLGQELCQMSVVRALHEADDVVLSNHRNHGHFLTYSGKFTELVAEIMGRKDGVCGGRGGSQHLAYRGFHSNGVQGGMIGIGVGLAYARKLGSSSGIVAIMIGDGTLGQGLVYESFNLASIWGLPVLFVVENNRIAQTTETSGTMAGSIEQRGDAFGLLTWRLDDSSPTLFEQTEGIVATIREGSVPGLLVIDTCRLGPHSKGDDLRSAEEMDRIRARDPLTKLAERLTKTEKEAIDERNRTFVKTVEKAALASPEARFDEVPRHIFDPLEKSLTPAARVVEDGVSVRSVLNAGLRHLLETSEKVILLGEDLHDPYGGAFKVTDGLSTEFSGRVISTPISEAGIMGTAIGLAMAGYRPIVEIMFADFLTLCMDQIYNHAVKFPGIFPEIKIPLVIRTPAGGRRGYGPTHSQSPENLLSAVPGLTLVYGSHRHAMDQLLFQAVNDWPYPVLFMEHKLLYGETQSRADYTELPPAKGDIAAELFPTLIRKRPGADLTILTFGGMLLEVEKAVQYLEDEEEIEVEIVVPSLLTPFPKQSVIQYLLAAPLLAVIEESHCEYGVSAEILASLVEARYSGHVIRIGTPPVPIASARSLERQIIPGQEDLIQALLKLFD